MDLKFFTLDTESNGTGPQHEITQISIIRHEDKNQLTKWIKIEHPERTAPQALTATGRTYKDLLRGEPKEKVVEICENFITNNGTLSPEQLVFIAHNANFDRRFLHALWASVGKKFPGHLWLCTMEISRAWAKKLGIQKPKLTLTASLEFTNTKPIDTVQHEAASDTRNTWLLFKKATESGIDYLDFIKRIPHNYTGQ